MLTEEARALENTFGHLENPLKKNKHWLGQICFIFYGF